ncbi:MAG: SPOR domain-containing protein [Heliobacteriaceae bacterium]|jgi:cell division septation protein DedD|nr:SPOR domain-containing protein [Heliobacteriaceae bacterium]
MEITDNEEYGASGKPVHITYRQYQKKVTKKSTNEGVMIFVSAFFIMLLLFLAIAKQISPDVDVVIGTDTEKTEVDDRLRMLQQEDESGTAASDNTSGPTDEMFTPELDEKIEIPSKTKKPDESETAQKPAVKPAEQLKSVEIPLDQPKITAKVVVGSYATEEQARVAKDILSESGLSPFIRPFNGMYTLQVGSYSTREKAQNIAGELSKSGYPARVILE